jgi:starch synthase
MSDDPYFAGTKVVYSVFDDEFQNDLDPNIRKKIKLEGITDKDVEVLNPASFANLTKLAIDNSDGIIKGSEKINPEVEQYIKDSGKPFLEYQPEDKYIDAFNEFYDSL